MSKNKSLNTFEEQFKETRESGQNLEITEKDVEKYLGELAKDTAEFTKTLEPILSKLNETTDYLSLISAASALIGTSLGNLIELLLTLTPPEEKKSFEEMVKNIEKEANIIGDNFNKLQKEHNGFDSIAIALFGTTIITSAMSNHYIRLRKLSDATNDNK